MLSARYLLIHDLNMWRQYQQMVDVHSWCYLNLHRELILAVLVDAYMQQYCWVDMTVGASEQWDRGMPGGKSLMHHC